MRITYQTTVADHRAAYRMYQSKNIFLRYDQILWPAVAFFFLVVILITDHRSELNKLAQALVIAPIWFSLGLPLIRRYNAAGTYRAAYGKSPKSPELITEITSDRIVDIAPGQAESIYEWSSVIGFGQNSRITVFYMKTSNLVFFPTSALSPDQRVELDGLISKNGIKRWTC